jgi:hypothetical protein
MQYRVINVQQNPGIASNCAPTSRKRPPVQTTRLLRTLPHEKTAQCCHTGGQRGARRSPTPTSAERAACSSVPAGSSTGDNFLRPLSRVIHRNDARFIHDPAFSLASYLVFLGDRRELLECGAVNLDFIVELEVER